MTALAINPEVEFPDAEQVMVTYLSGLLTEHVGTVVPPDGPDRPTSFVVLLRTGGPRINAVIDGAQLTFDAYALTESDAVAVARRVRRFVTAAPGQIVDVEGWGPVTIYGVDEGGGPANFPDPRTTLPRYTQTHRVRMRGNPPATGS